MLRMFGGAGPDLVHRGVELRTMDRKKALVSTLARNPPGGAPFGWLLCRSLVKDHSGYSPSSLRASSQNSQQRHYTSH
jgi:hypothetical protein